MAERDRWEQLLLLERGGEITGLKRQRPVLTFSLRGPDGVLRDLTTATGRKIRYTPDFSFHDVRTGRLRLVDVKGVLTRDAALRIALVRAVHGIEVELEKAPRRRR